MIIKRFISSNTVNSIQVFNPGKFLQKNLLPISHTRKEIKVNNMNNDIIIKTFSIKDSIKALTIYNANNDRKDLVSIDNDHHFIKPLILYEDSLIMCVWKPPGFVVNPSKASSSEISSSKFQSLDERKLKKSLIKKTKNHFHQTKYKSDSNNNKIQPDLISNLRYYLQKEYLKAGNAFLAPCHFIDRAVSGIMVFAKRSKAAMRMHKLFLERDFSLQKEYVCVVHGIVPVGHKQTLENMLRLRLPAEYKSSSRKRVIIMPYNHHHHDHDIDYGHFHNNKKQYKNKKKDKYGRNSDIRNRVQGKDGRYYNRYDNNHNNHQINYDNNNNNGSYDSYKKESNKKSQFGGKYAKLSFESLTTFRTLNNTPLSLLRVKLHTGRKHQIRAQLAHIGHPIHGDSLYGDLIYGVGVTSGIDSKSRLQPERIALHAYHLSIPHPTRNHRVSVSAMPPDYWMRSFSSKIVEHVEKLIDDIQIERVEDSEFKQEGFGNVKLIEAGEKEEKVSRKKEVN